MGRDLTEQEMESLFQARTILHCCRVLEEKRQLLEIGLGNVYKTRRVDLRNVWPTNRS
jgi:hypothetical protein